MPQQLHAVPGAPPRAVLYLRQSTHREESISLELQETACRDYAARRGYVVVDVISDPGVSGLKWERRPGVQQVLTMVEARECEVVLVWRWSRLSRRRLHQAVALDRVERAGGRVESATEPFDTTTAGGEFGRDVLLAAAHFESRQKAEQWREAHQRRLGLGLPACGGDRYGYVRTEAGEYTPDPGTAPVLTGMYEAYLAGAGFTAIAADLNRAGRRTLAGGTWTRDRVTRVLDSGFGAGQLVTGRGSAAVYVAGRQPPVVDEAMWQAYVAARRRRRGVAPRSVEPVYVLSGLIRCGDCGSPMHATRLGRHAGYGYWCSRWAASRACRCVTVSRAKAEGAVVEWLRAVASDIDRAAALEAERAAAVTVAKVDAENVARQVTRLDAQLDRLTLGWSDGLVPDESYRRTRGQLDQRRGELLSRLAELEGEQRESPVGVAGVAATLLQEWDLLPVRERRELLSSLIAQVRVVRPLAGERGAVRVEIVSR